MLKTKLPPSKITVPAFAFENIPVGGEHRLVPLTVQTDGLHDGQWVPATLTVVVEGSVQYGAESDPRLGLGLGAESLTPCQENVLLLTVLCRVFDCMDEVVFHTPILSPLRVHHLSTTEQQQHKRNTASPRATGSPTKRTFYHIKSSAGLVEKPVKKSLLYLYFSYMHVLHCLKCSQTSVIYEFFFSEKKSV